jgi:hypothetical protein
VFRSAGVAHPGPAHAAQRKSARAPVRKTSTIEASGCGAAWLARLLGVQEVPGSNPGSPTKFPKDLQKARPRWRRFAVQLEFKCERPAVRLPRLRQKIRSNSWRLSLARRTRHSPARVAAPASPIGVDPCTLARWERGVREPAGAFAVRVVRFLTNTERAWAGETARTA